MNELPIIEGYVRLSLKSWLILTAIISFNTIYFVFAGHLSVFLLFLIILNVFPNHEIVRHEFKDGIQPLKINLSDLDVPVEVLYKNIVERIN